MFWHRSTSACDGPSAHPYVNKGAATYLPPPYAKQKRFLSTPPKHNTAQIQREQQHQHHVIDYSRCRMLAQPETILPANTRSACNTPFVRGGSGDGKYALSLTTTAQTNPPAVRRNGGGSGDGQYTDVLS